MTDRAGLIAAGHPAVAEAAATTLRAGGNAFDAAVAAGFSSAHCEPGFTSLAGGGFLLARTADREQTIFDFFVDTPGRGLAADHPATAFDPVTVDFVAARQVFHCGLGSVAVPGNLAGYLHIHRRLGRLPLADVVAPAVHLARHGVRVPATQAADFALLAPILQRTAAAREIFCPGGRLLTTDDTLVNHDLAAFLERLGVDPAATFYTGGLARRLHDQMAGSMSDAAGAGLVTAQDLAAYRVVERRPLVARHGGHAVLTNPPPSFGGSLIVAVLSRFAELSPRPPPGSPELAVALVELMAEVDRERRGATAQPPAEPAVDDGRPVSTTGTTHVSIADAEGNVASMTTSNGECSGDVIPGTGILLNNMLGEDDLHPHGFHQAPPGLRVASMMSPTIVLGADGAPVLALGSGGSKRIRSAIVQVLLGVLHDGLPLVDAVDRPRLHWDDDHVEAEPGLEDAVLESLHRIAPVNVWPERSLYFGGVHAVAPGGADRSGQAAGDARRGGAVRIVP